ncbi:hypothetical protein PF003_g11076 [Phytophthora fragariae]|nr:hypothetical protein PF003_g11076 [Phytophthora fragariae]
MLDEGEGIQSEYDRARGKLVHPDRQHREDHFLRQIGKRVILPDSHVGGPRFMYKAYQDSMAIVREYGKPDVFVTTTCNPKWEEIEEKISDPLQSAQDRPDIVARVWQQKLKALLKNLDEGVLGRLLARIYVVEFQKRGLPHAHILIILEDEDKPRNREIIDKLVSTELPDLNVNPDLFDTVMTCMMHGPCGEAYPSSPCMKDGKCSKGFPKPLVEVTRANQDGYPVYRRRRREPDVLTYKGKTYDNETVNQWVVPYSPYLSQKYNCHINVEVCTAITAIKYMYKYVYKWPDRAVITIEAVRDPTNPRDEPNEILRFLNARYISPVEACMRLLAFEIQGKTHSIIRLTVHLEGGQMIVFEPTDDPAVVAERDRRTTLTSFFELCASEEPEDQIAKTMLYHDIPKQLSWDNKAKKWVRRSKYQAAIGRLIHVSPRDIERFYLRVLLCHRRGPTSFKDLQTVDGVVHPTFQKASMYAGFLENDQEWVACMSEASSFKMPIALQQLFATLLVYSQVSDVHALWDQFYGELSRGFAFTYRNLEGQTKEDTIQFHTLMHLNDLLQISGYAVHHFELPQLCEHRELVLTSLLENNLIRRELEGYNHDVLHGVHDRTDELNDGQRAIYDQIMDAVERPQIGKKLFFVDGPGGTGKSTLLRHILASVRLSGKIAIAVSSSGIAALLLMGGRTAHSTFKIPMKLNEHSTCSIYKQSKLRKLLQAASFIIWDEAPMTHRHAFEAVDRSLRDILDNDQEPFGGKTFVLSGDFRKSSLL